MFKVLIAGALAFTWLIGLGIYTAGIAAAGSDEVKPISQRTYSLEQLQDDYHQLQNKIMSKHPRLYDKNGELEKFFNKRYNLLKDGMTELEFYRILTPIIARVGCGHTILSCSEEYENYLKKNGRFFPAEVKMVDGKLYILKDLSRKRIPAGSEIISIDGRPASAIIADLTKNISSDGYNRTKKLYIVNHWFNSAYYYYIENPESFIVKLKNSADGGLSTGKSGVLQTGRWPSQL